MQTQAFRKLLHALPIAALLVDQRHDVVFANEYWQRTMGSTDKVTGRKFSQFFLRSDQAERVESLLTRAFEDRKPRIRKLALNVGGKKIWGHMHLRPIRMAVGRFFLILYEDLTLEKEQLLMSEKHSEYLHKAHEELEKRIEERTVELKKTNSMLIAEIAEREFAEAALRESQVNYRAIFDAVNDAIIVLDANNGDILDVNSKMCDLYGYTSEEVKHLDLDDLTSNDPVYSQKDTMKWLRLPTAEDAELFTWMAKDRSGRSFWVEVSLKRATIGGNNRVLAVVRDISERKQLEEQLRQAQKMEAIGRLAGGMAHDYNNILTAIMGYSNLLLQETPQENRFHQRLKQIAEAAERAAGLTNQLLAFSRRQILNMKVLNLNDVIADLSSKLQDIVGDNINLVTILDPAIGEIKADRSQIEQILVHLTLNSRDAMPDGGEIIVELSNVILDERYARIHEDVLPGAYVMMAVSDSGHGMHLETVSRIFEPFFTTKEGTGLGLSMVFGIVRQHQGHITVRSEPNFGTTFKIFLPSLKEIPEFTKTSTGSQKLGNETVLVVDDESMVREVVCEMLQTLGYTVLEACDAEEAFQVCKRHEGHIDLLITDVVMPRINGSQLYAQLRAVRPDLKVLYMSGYTENAIAHHGVLKPGVHFMPKPFSGDILATKAREVLDVPVGMSWRNRIPIVKIRGD